MALPDVPVLHLLSASDRGRLNVLHNGGFTAYPAGLGVVEDTLELRKGIGTTGVLRYDLIDQRLYRAVSASFSIPASSSGEHVLGHWAVYGSGGSVEIAPIDSATGAALTPIDGGNLARFSFTESGTITLSQLITDPAPLRGENLSLTYTGRSFAGTVKVNTRVLVDGVQVGALLQQSQTFGAYRRPQFDTAIPITAKVIEVRFELEAGPGASVGFSGIAGFPGPTGPSASYTPSIVDLTIPSGTVILWEGLVCPAGYRQLPGSDQRMILLTGGPANMLSASGEAIFIGGQDTHDHHPEGPVDSLETPLGATHGTDVPIPFESQTAVHGVAFGTQDQYPGEKPVIALGVNHTHQTRTLMTAVPPCFPVRCCVKI